MLCCALMLHLRFHAEWCLSPSGANAIVKSYNRQYATKTADLVGRRTSEVHAVLCRHNGVLCCNIVVLCCKMLYYGLLVDHATWRIVERVKPIGTPVPSSSARFSPQ